jgi:membrane protease YdiL (CAAX protease family)
VEVSGRLVAWAAFVAVLSALSYGFRLSDEAPPEDYLYTYTAVVSGLVQFGVMLAIVLAIARGTDARRVLALRRPLSWASAAKIAFGVFAGMLVLLAVLGLFLHPGEEQGLVPEDWDPSRADAFAANFVLIVVFAPFVEELAFRGLGFSLLERFGTRTAIVLVGIAFAVAHGLVQALPLLAAFGAGLAYLRSRTRSLYPCIALHGAFNAFALIASVAM